MGGKKKINPRRKPTTQADVDRAKVEATTVAMHKVLSLVLFVLKDKHNASDEDICQLASEVDYYADSIREGRISWNDVERTLNKEYDLYLPW